MTHAICFAVVALLACAMAAPRAAFAACGDGVVEAPLEQCDDGNTDAGDCCAADCLFEPEDSPCGLDDICLAAGAAACDVQGECALPTGVFCFGGGRADLSIPSRPEAQRFKIRAGWTLADDTIGDPSLATQYAICVYNFSPSGRVVVDYRQLLPVGEGWEPAPDGFVYRKPAGATSALTRARVKSRAGTTFSGAPYYQNIVRLVARGQALDLPGPVDSSRYFDATQGVSSACIVNELGFLTGVNTWDAGSNRSFINEPDHVRWTPPRLPD